MPTAESPWRRGDGEAYVEVDPASGRLWEFVLPHTTWRLESVTEVGSRDIAELFLVDLGEPAEALPPRDEPHEQHPPEPPNLTAYDVQALIRWMRALSAWLDNAQRVAQSEGHERSPEAATMIASLVDASALFARAYQETLGDWRP